MVVTGKARAAIRRASRSQARRQYAGLGRHTLERRFEQAGKAVQRGRRFAAAARGWTFPRWTTCWRRWGADELSADSVLKEVHPDYRDGRVSAADAPRSEEGWTASGRSSLKFRLPRRPTARRTRAPRIPIRGLDADIPVRFAPDGGAVPGDRIVGILTPGEGITIYPIHSPAARPLRRRAGALGRRALGHLGAVRRSAFRRASASRR